LPLTKPYPEIEVASSVTPSGGRLAGRHGFGMLCVAATNPLGYDALGINWDGAQKPAAENGRTLDPTKLRLVGPMHLAETRAEARKQVQFGFHQWSYYFNSINRIGAADLQGRDPIDAMIENGAGIVGTPDDAIAQIERLEQKIPNFGTYLMLAHNWSNFADTKRSYALFAQHVKPHFNKENVARAESLQWAADNSAEFMGAAMGAAAKTIEKYRLEEAEKAQAKQRA
jgi:limonene 1,2-monooxygenase